MRKASPFPTPITPLHRIFSDFTPAINVLQLKLYLKFEEIIQTQLNIDPELKYNIFNIPATN